MADYPADTETEEAPATTYPAVQLPPRKEPEQPARPSVYAASTERTETPETPTYPAAPLPPRKEPEPEVQPQKPSSYAASSEAPEPTPPEQTYRAGEPPQPFSTGTTGEWNAPRVVPTRPPPTSESGKGGEPTPVEMGGVGDKMPAKPPPIDPDSIPDWTSVTKTQTYQAASDDDRLAMLDNYTQTARDAGHALAAKNNEDPALYDKHIDQFYAREKDALQGPFSVFDNSVKTGVKEAAKTTENIAAGAAQNLKTLLQPEALNLNLSDIGKLSIDEAKDQRDKLLDLQKNSQDDFARAQQFIDNTKAGVRDDDYAGGLPGAIKTLRDQTSNQKTVDALNKYIDSKGQNVPEDTAPDKAINWLKNDPANIDQIKIDDIYLREHPRLAEFSKSVGHMIPFLAANAAASTLEGGLGPITFAADLFTNVNDAFSTHYDGAKEQIEQREKNGEYFTPYEKEQMALNDGSRAAFGVGLFNAAANVILGSAMEGMHVPEGAEMDFGAMKSNLANWLKGDAEEGVRPQLFPDAAKPIAAEIAGQTGLAAGSQIASNWADKSSGVDPNRDLMQGVPESMGQGMIFGGLGATARAAATAFKLGLNTAKVHNFSNVVRQTVDHLTSDDDDGGGGGGGGDGTKSATRLTNEQALEVALHEHVPPAFRDSVRAKIALDETAKDQANVSEELREDGNTETADAMQKAADTDANTKTTGVTSKGDKLKADQDEMTRAIEERKAKDAAAKKPKEGEEGKPPAPTEEGKPPTEGGTPPPPPPEGTPPEGGGTPPEGGVPPTGTAETPTETTTLPEPVKQGASNEELHAKMDQLLGPDATNEQKRKILNSQYFTQVYNEFQKTGDPDENLYRRSYPTQMAHELGITPLAKAPAKWSAHTPELQAEMRNHFSDWLDKQIAEKNAPKEEAPTPTVPKAGPPGTEVPKAEGTAVQPTPVLPPEVMNDAIKSNDPEPIRQALLSGKKIPITEDQRVDEANDKFFYDHKFDVVDDPDNPGHFFLKELEEPNIPSIGDIVKKPKKEKLVEADEDEAAAPKEGEEEEEEDEPEKEAAIQGAGSAGETDLIKFRQNSRKFLDKTETMAPHPEEEAKLKDALRQINVQHGYKFDQANMGLWRADAETAALSGFHRDLRAKPDAKLSVERNINQVILDYKRQLRTQKNVGHFVESLDQPISTAEGSELSKHELERYAGPKEKEDIDPRPILPHGTVEYTGLGHRIIEDLNLKSDEKRWAWHYLELLSTDPATGERTFTRPEGEPGATGIKDEVQRATESKIHKWFRENTHPVGSKEEALAGLQSGPSHGAEAGHGTAPQQPAVHAAPHQEPVPEHERSGGVNRAADEKPGGRESGVPEAGQTAAGQTPGVLPGTAGSEGAAGHVAAGSERERAGPLGGTGITTAPTGEQAIHIRPRDETATEGAGSGGRPGGAGGSEPAGGVASAKPTAEEEAPVVRKPKEGWDPLKVANAMLEDPMIASDHGFDVEEDGDPHALAEEIIKHQGDQHPDDYYGQLYHDLGLDDEPEEHEPEEKPAPKPDEQPNVPRPQTVAAAKLKAVKMTVPEQKALDARIGEGANILAKDLWANKPKMSAMGFNPKDFDTVNDFVVRIGEMFQGISKGKSFQEAMDTIQGMVPKLLAEPDLPGEPAAPTAEQTAAKIQGLSIQTLAKTLADYFKENPDRAMAYGMGGHDRKGIMQAVGQMFKDPEEQRMVLQSMAQKEGIIEPPTTPGGTERSGVMNSLVTGMKHTGPTQGGKVTDLISWLRRSPDPELRQFARSLNGNRDAVENIPIRQLNHNAPVAFYHDGELWASPSMVRSKNSQKVIAHEIQHAIAQRKVTEPMLPHDFAAAGSWEDLRDELRQSLPADLRDALDSHLAHDFSTYDGREEMDTRYMTDDEKNWLPVLYAAHSSENMLHATFSNRHFRDHLEGIKRADGSNLLDAVQSWGRTVFGDQAFKFADEAHPYVSDRPGIPAQFDPKVFDLKDSYDLTESEKNAQKAIGKYQLHNGVEAALRQVEALSDNPNHKVLGSALAKIVANHPEIKLAIENRVGGYAGGYDFKGDRVSVNPHLDDNNIEQTIIHEVVHAMTLGKIDAFEKGQVHLLTPDEMHAVGDLEEMREKALLHKDVPDVIKQIATLPTYQQREAALLDLFQSHPEMEKWYGLTDTREFASEALSNGGLQDHLRKIPFQTEGARPKNLLHQMFDWVKRFLGFKDNTVASKAFDAVATLSGGRRVMEADVNSGNLASGRTMMMQENLLAKRYLDHRAELEGFRGGAAQVPNEQLNSWLNEYRQNKGMASGMDAYAPRSIAPPETRAHFKPTPELMAMTQGHEILDHLGKVSGIAPGDTDGLSVMADRAFKDKAINTQQYFAANAALRGREEQTMNRLFVKMGDKENQDSLISRIERAWKETTTPHGTLPHELKEELLKHEKYGQNLTATQIRRKFEAFDKAVRQSYKGVKLTPKIRGDMNKVLLGEPVPRTMPTAVVDALQDMRADLDANSKHIVINGMVSDDKAFAIRDNMGKYITRSYRMFDDPSYRFRTESTQWRAKAESEVGKAFYTDAAGRKQLLLSPSQRTALVKAYAEHEAAEAARPFSPATSARQAAYDKAYAAAEAKGKANPAALFIDEKMAEWTQIARNRATKGMQYGHLFNINDKNMEELSPILNQSPSFRKLMGEETDPKALYARSNWRQAAFIHSVEMSREAAALGQQNGWLSDKFSNKLSAQIPAEFSHMGELAGKYTTPEIADAITDHAQNMRAAQEGVVSGTLRSLEGAARWNATIGSLQRGVGNVWSGIFAHLNNGYFNPFDTDAIKASADLFKSQIMRMNDDQLNAYIDQMHKYGLTDKTGNVGLVMDFLKNGPHLAHDPLDVQEQFMDYAKKVGQNKILRTVGEGLMDMHTFGNLMSKGSQWEREVKRRQEVNDWDVKNRGAAKMANEQLRAKAAEIVRNQNISYSLATKTIQQMRKNPTLGTFLTFWGESLRSYGSSIGYALDGLKSSNPVERQIGVARMGGLLTALAIPGALMMASRAVYGVSSKEDRNFRQLLPPWEQHNSFLYGPEVNGRRTYTNINYNTPQGDIARMINAFFTPNPGGIIGQVGSALREGFTPVFNLPLVGSGLMDIYRNQTEYGTQVYNPDDNFWNKSSDMVQHVFHQVAGGTFGRIGSKIIPALTTPGGKVTPGGSVYDFTSAVLPEFSGFNVKEISFPDRFRSEMYSTKDSIDHAQRLFTGPIQQSHNQLTDSQIKGLYQRAEDARRNVFNSLHQKVEAARFGGMTSQQIKTTLKGRRYSTQEIEDIMTGRYRAYKPSAAVLKNARANGNFMPPGLFGRATTQYEDTE